MTSQTIIYPKPNPIQKNNPNFEPQISILSMWYSNTRKGRIFAGLALGLGILDYTLNLTQWGVSVTYVVILSTITL